MKKLACLFLILAASGCPDVKVDPYDDETRAQPVVEFDPSNRIVPFPNNLLLDPSTGKVNLPAQCGETPTAKALREGVLNQLDGFGLFETALTVTFSEGVDPDSLADRIVLYKRATGTTPVDPAAAAPIPFVTQVGATVRFDAACATPSTITQLAVIPLVPLEQQSTYVVALLGGIKTVNGATFEPSGTWRLIRGAENPVTVDESGVIVSDRTPLDPGDEEDRARLLGIDLLWKAHAGAVKFLASDLPADKRRPREQILLAWEFRTQTATDPLDPAVAGSPASEIDTATGLVMNTSLPLTINRANPPYNQCPGSDSDTQCFLKIALGNLDYATGNARCQALGCAAISDVVGSGLFSKQYQLETPNPYMGMGAEPIPGQWGDPRDPAEVKNEAIEVLSFVPATPAPAGGYPVVVFQHGLGQSKTNAFAIAGNLAAAGFATVAIDAVAHDSRAVRVSSDPALGCGDSATSTRPDLGPSPVDFPQCYAPFLSPNLGATRDGIRQTVIDQQRLVAALKVCGATPCGNLAVDPTRILYLGQSLGGVIGSMSAAITPDVKASVLNVPAVGWVDILENTGTLRLQCLLVDGLIDAGILQGEKSSPPGNPTMGLCTTPAWKMQPGYRQFAVIGRWILDPADPANFTRKLAARRFLIQQVDGDTVFPNLATMNQGMLVGLTAATADPIAPPDPPPAPPPAASGAITTNPTTSKWVRYPMVPLDAGTGFPGNTFGHGSLLQPADGTAAGSLGTLRMRTDALTYLVANSAP